MTDPRPQVQNEAQQTLQEIIDRLGSDYAGADADQVRAALVRAIDDAGIPEQPEKWVTDAAEAIADGRTMVADRNARDEDDPRRHG